MKKLTILSIIFFSFLLINTDEVKAYQVTHTSADGSVTATANVPDNLPYYMVFEINTNQLILMAAENPIKAGGEAGYPYTDGLINFYRQNSRYSWNSVYKSVNDSYSGAIVMFCHSEADCLTTFKRVDAQANHDIYYQDTDTLIIPKTLGLYEYNFNSVDNRQLFSLDFYFTEEDLNLDKNFEIDITNLDKERYSIFHLDNFLYYGLVNDNGLYHWEEIQPNNKDIEHNNWIEDYEEVYKCNNNHIIDNCGFNLKFKNIGIDFIDGKYEKIRFSVTFTNAIKYDLKIKSPYELTKDNFYYNRVGQDFFVLKNNTQDFPYLVFSTKKDNLHSSIFSEYDSDNHILYSSYFDTENGSSLDSILDFESQYKEFQDNIPFNIGLSNKKGLWISSNHDDFFDYYVYYDGFNLYYSLNSNHDLEDSIYIDNSGNNVILPLIPQVGDKYYDDNFISSFKRVFKKFIKTLNYIFDNVSLFFNNLPLNFQEYYIFIFGFIIFLIVIKFIL